MEEKKPMKKTPPMLVNEITRLFQARMRGFDVGGVMTQDSARLIMRELMHSDGCTQLDLVRKTHLKAPTVSVTLKRMEAEGLVKRVPDVRDLRAIRVHLSERGREHNRRVHERLSQIDGTLMQGFDPEEVEVLTAFLIRMRDNILENEAEGGRT